MNFKSLIHLVKLVLLNLVVLAILTYVVYWIFLLVAKKEMKIGQVQKINGQRLLKIPNSQKYLKEIGFFTKFDKPISFINFPSKKMPDKIRIGCFGDSHTYGEEVTNGNDFPSLLQNMLPENFEVLNFGHSRFSFGQTLSLIDLYADKYELDIVILGPSGTHADRMLTFTGPWQRGYPPSFKPRFILENQKLRKIDLESLSYKQLFKQASSFFVPWKYWEYDLFAPGPLKLVSYFTNYQFLNPFYSQTEPHVEARAIQLQLLKNYLKPSTRTFHFFYDESLQKMFSRDPIPSYSTHKISQFLKSFPYRAPYTHSSPFGNYMVARSVAQQISSSIQPLKWELKDDISFSESIPPQKDTEDPKLYFSNLGVSIDEKVVGRLGDAKNYDQASDPAPLHRFAKDEYLIGFYGEGMSRANSFFVVTKLKGNKLNFFPKPDQVDILDMKLRVIFVKYSPIQINHFNFEVQFPPHVDFDSISVNGTKILTKSKSPSQAAFSRFYSTTPYFYRIHIFGNLDISTFDFEKVGTVRFTHL